MVRKFSDVFSDKLSRLPLESKINFSIKLVPNTVPISFPPYHIVPVEFKKSKVQLQDLVEKIFIRYIRGEHPYCLQRRRMVA